MATDLNDQTLIERVDPLLNAVFDRRYRIDERLAAGGFGAIYRAEHIASKRQVALKVLLPSLTHDPGVVARFRREGATLTALRSQHTITAYELGEAPDGTLYIVMELLRGVTLFERYRAGGPIPWRTMVSYARAVCRSLEEAHGLGVIHRDLKPTNIHLEPAPDGGDIVKVLDFGIAKILRDSDFDSSDLTNAGQMIGTLDYMSPEQMVGGACTGHSDIYTLGIVMYEMVAGRRPFDEQETAAATLAQMIKSNPVPLAQRTPVPPAFDALVMRCLDRDPKRRFPDVRTLGVELDRALGDDEGDVTRTVAAASELLGEEMTVVGSGRARGARGVSEPAPTHLPVDAIPIPTTPRPQPPPPSVVTPVPIRVTPPHSPASSSAPVGGPRPASPTSSLGPGAMPGGYPPAAGAKPVISLVPPPGAPIQPGQPRAGSTTSPPLGMQPGRVVSTLPPHASAHAPFGGPPPMPGMPPPWGAAAPPPSSGYSPTRMPGVQQFDMASMAARDAAIRRIVWIAVLVIGTILGAVVAAQL